MKIVLLLIGLLLFPVLTHAYTLDAYGGINEIACPSGSATHFYREKIGSHHFLCTPAGHGFFMMGLTLLNNNNAGLTSGQFQTKYGSASNPYTIGGLTAAQIWPYNYYLNKISQLKQWNFNVIADGLTTGLLPSQVDTNWNTSDHTLPAAFRMPFVVSMNTSHYAALPGGPPGCDVNYPLKGIFQGEGAAFGGSYTGAGDFFDPHWPTCINNLAAAYFNTYGITSPSSPHADYAIYASVDEGDLTGFLNGVDPTVSGFLQIDSNTGAQGNLSATAPHMGWATLASDPMRPNGNALGGIPLVYSDSELYTKVELANELVTKYLCTAASTPLACCTGNETGTCSVDPGAGAGTAVTGANMTTATNALNAAWGSYYTTLGTSDAANCAASLATCLQTGTYAPWGDNTTTVTCAGASCSGTLTPHPIVEYQAGSNVTQNGFPRWFTTDGVLSAWTNGSGTITGIGVTGGSITDATGVWSITFSSSIASHTVYITWRTVSPAAHSTGTGLLDEDGACPSKGVHSCWMGSAAGVSLTGMTAPAQADLNAFLYNYTYRYFNIEATGVHAILPGLIIQMSTCGYGEPCWSPTMQAMRDLDIFPQIFIPEYCPTCTDMQARIDAVAADFGDNPWMIWSGYHANPDSAKSGNVLSNDISSTQAGRAAVYATLMGILTNGKTTAYNSYPVVGMYWWGAYDTSESGGTNWGLMTPSDNAYDGVEAVITPGTNSWGYSDGGEAANYGNFLGGVTTANQAVLTTFANEFAGVGGSNGSHGGSFW